MIPDGFIWSGTINAATSRRAGGWFGFSRMSENTVLHGVFFASTNSVWDGLLEQFNRKGSP